MQEFNPYAPSQVQHTQAPANTGDGVQLTPRAYNALTGSKVWVRIISIMFFVMAALFTISNIIKMNTIKQTPFASAARSGGYQVGTIIGLLIVVTIFSLLGLRLHSYSKAIGSYSTSKNPQDLNKAMESQTKFWRLVGILTNIYLSFMLLAMLIGAII